MISLAIEQFRSRWQRSLAVCIAVVLGVAFFTIALLAGGPLNQSLREGVGQQIYGADLLVTADRSLLTQSELDLVHDVDGVESADFASYGAAEIDTSGTRSSVLVSDVPEVPEVRENIELASGTWPQQSGEIVLSENSMDVVALGVDDDVSIFSWEAEQSESFRIVGVFESPSGLARGRADVFLHSTDYHNLMVNPYNYAIRVKLTEGAHEGNALSAVQSSLESDFDVLKFNDYVEREVDQFAGSTVAIQVVLAAFAAIAMVASGIVIANSFEISVTQRVREIGLLRTVGATNRQIRRMVISEALVVGTVASIVGVAVGTGIMALGSRLAWSASGLEVTPVSLLGPFALGVLATLFAALGPARSAMRVHPLQAIRQADAPMILINASTKRTVFVSLLFIIGIAIMIFAGFRAMNGDAQSGTPLLIGIVGGACTFLAVLMSAQSILPKIATMLGSVMRRAFGVTGELAAGNLGRTPRRTASAAAALLVGVTLMTMMTVGASSIESTIISEVRDREPIDLEIRAVSTTDQPVAIEHEFARWEQINEIQSLTGVDVAELEVGENGTNTVLSVDPDKARGILRSDAAADLSDATIIVSPEFASMNGLREGDSLELAGPDSTRMFDVIVQETSVREPVIARSSMQLLDVAADHTGVWIRLDEASEVSDVVTEIRTGIPANLELTVSGGAAERESTLEVLDTMLLVVIGLLAAAVVIAIVGIGNTLTLSVIERTRESGMLRAMGLKRGEVRRMLAIEGMAISLIGALTGLVLGVIFGIAGVLTLFGDSLSLTISVPWIQLGIICVVAVVAGLVASVVPARRALRIKPVEALADIG